MNRLLICLQRRSRLACLGRDGFTLVEVLVVLVLLSILTAIALPVAKQLLLDQKNSRTARSIIGYIGIAHGRAIAEQRQVGVLVERLSTDSTNEYGSSASIRLRHLTGVPPYSGDSADVRANLLNLVADTGTGAIPGIDTASFDINDNQLLLVSYSILHDSDTSNDHTAPIRPGRDRLELPGGRIVTIQPSSTSPLVHFVPRSNLLTDPVQLRFDLREEETSSTSFQNPQSSRRELTPVQQVRFKIHRAPSVSSTAPLTFPRGVAIDLNYSGVGLTGHQFDRDTSATTNQSIAIVFGPDGRVTMVNDALGNAGTPTGQLFLCLGDSDGVRPDNLFVTERRSTANILNLKSSWIVINHATGRATSAPFTAVSPATIAMPATTTAEIEAKLTQALRDARQLAVLSDTLDAR